MSQKTTRNSKGGLRFFVALLVALATVIGAIEWARQTRSVDTGRRDVSVQDSRAFPRELRSAADESITIPRAPRRIVSQTLATDEILLAICSPERISALSNLAEDDDYSNVVEASRRVAGRTTHGAEQILQFQPDLVFVASYSRAETVQLLKAAHAPVLQFANFNSISDIKKNIVRLGYAIGEDEKAAGLVRRMEDDLRVLRERAPVNQAPFKLMSFGLEHYTAGTNTTFDDIVRATGAVNVSAEHGIDGYGKIDSENLLEWQPDFIVTGAKQAEFESARRNLLADPVIAVSKAGRDGKIIVIDNRHFLTVSQYIVRAAEDLADGIYGNRQ